MKKGFTLLELLATIVVIAVIAVIAVPTVLGIITSVKTQSYYRQVEMVESAAELYISSKIMSNQPLENYILLSDLISSGRLSKIPNDNLNGGKFDGVIKVTQLNDGYDYEYLDVNYTSGEVVLIDSTRTVSSITIEGNTIQNKSIGLNLIDVSSFVNYAGGNLSVRQSYYKLITPTKIVATSQPLSAPLPGFKIYMNGKTTMFVSGYTDLSTAEIYYRCYDSSNVALTTQLTTSVNPTNGYFELNVSGIPNTTDYINIGIGNDQNSDYWLDKLQVQYTKINDLYNNFDPNSPTINYSSNINSVSSNISIGGINYAIPTLRKVGTYKDTYNLTTGAFNKNVDVKAFNGTENWNTDGVYYFVDSFGSSNNATIKDWFVSNSFYDSKANNATTYVNRFFFVESGAGYFEFSKYRFATVNDFKTYLSQENINGRPITVVHNLKTPTVSTIATVPSSNYNGYIYFPGEIKGNIIVQYQ